MALPVNIDTTYSDDPLQPGRKAHQQHHDLIHILYNDIEANGFVSDADLTTHNDASGAHPLLLRTADKGVANGVASLNASAKIPAVQLDIDSTIQAKIDTHDIATAAHAFLVRTAEKGVANGIATLNSSGKVPASQLEASTATVFDVRKYGAVGDGVTDNATAYANTMTAMAPGDIMFIPSDGKYKGNLTLTKPIKVRGSGRPSVQKNVLTVTNKALTSNVATLTTSTVHGLVVGRVVLVEGVDATFNGLYTVTGIPSTTTFTYAKTAANVASQSATGTAQFNTLENGTVLIGFIDLAGKIGAEVHDLGIEQTLITSANGLSSDQAGALPNSTTELHQLIQNLTILGRGYNGGALPGNSAHGVSYETGTHLTALNIRVYGYAHGIALKASYSTVSDIYAEDTDLTAVIVKSQLNPDGSGSVEYVNIDNVIARATRANMRSRIVIQSTGATSVTRFINVNNFVSYDSSHQGVFISQDFAGNGFTSHINVTNCHVFSSGSYGYFVSAADVNGVKNVTFTNCHANGCLISFVNISGERSKAIACTSIVPTSGDFYGGTSPWEILQINNKLTMGTASLSNWPSIEVDKLLVIATQKTSTDSTTYGASHLIIDGTGDRTIGSGAALGFSAPIGSGSVAPGWEQARIVGAADNASGGNGAGRMYVQTRYYNGSAWVWRNNLVLKPDGNVGLFTDAPTHPLTIGQNTLGIGIYNTVDQTTNYERLRLNWGSNIATLGVEFGGTGLGRVLRLSAQGASAATIAMDMKRTAVPYLAVAPSAASADTGRWYEWGGISSAAADNTTFFSVIPVIQQSGTASYTALHVNVSETSTGSGANKLLDLQVGGTSKLSVDNAGRIQFGSTASIATAGVLVLPTAPAGFFPVKSPDGIVRKIPFYNE